MKPKASSWEYPEDSGVLIREITNRRSGLVFGTSFQVTIPGKLTGRGRMRKQFDTRSKAEEFADDQVRGTKQLGEEFFELPQPDRRDAVAALDLVRPHGLNLRQVVSDALAALAELRQYNVSLTEAAKYAGPRIRPPGGDRTVSTTVSEIVTSKQKRFESGQLRDRSFDDFKVRSNKFVETHGNTLIKEIDASAIKTWVQSLKLTARSNKNYLSVLSEIFRYAMQKKYIAQNPFADFTDHDLKELRGNDGDRGEPNILTIKQVEKLLTTALAHPELDLLAPVVLGLFCGIRTQELMKLSWSHVNIDARKPENSFVTIPKGIAKKRRIRNVSIPANALIWLALCPKKSGPITRNKYSTDYRKRFLKLQEKAGFGKVVEGVWRSTWEENGMRHSFGTYHYALHGNSIETARQLGHAASDHVLFDHYRALASKEQGEEYFNLLPPKSESVIVEFPKVAP